MLSGEVAERMISAPTFAEAARIASEHGFEDMSTFSVPKIERALAKRLDDEIADIAKLAPQKELIDIFRIKYDYHNLKVLVKSEDEADHRLLVNSGRVSPEVMIRAFEEDDFASFPEIMERAAKSARSVLARSQNPQLSDFEIDRAYFEELSLLASSCGNDFIQGYIKLLIDSANLRTAVRAVRMGKDTEFLSQVLVEGGNISAESIAEHAVEDRDRFAALYERTVLEKSAKLGVSAMDGGAMTEFELAVDNEVFGYLKEAAMLPFGAGVVAKYIANFETSITALRMILTGRSSGLEPEIIRERLRDIDA